MGRKDRGEGGLVYSSEQGTMCSDCEKPKKACSCKASKVPEGDGIVRVGRETKGRKGKGVTVVTGVLLADKELTKLAKELKKRCGSGGTVKEGVIEIQGDHRDVLVAELTKRGYKVKRSGG